MARVAPPPLGQGLEGHRIRLVASPGGYAIVAAGGETIGRLELDSEGDVLFVKSLCIDEGHRGFGAGSEAGRLVRESAAAGPWHTLRAWAPPDRGLAVYFWFRMGLHPVPGDGPHGGLQLERQVG